MAGVRDLVDELEFRTRRIPSFWTTVLLVAGAGIVYIATARYPLIGTPNDAACAALPAWRWASDGTLDLNGFSCLGPWVVDIGGGILRTDRFPGPILLAYPFYYWQAETTFVMGPAAVSAAVATAAALGFLHRALLVLVRPAVALGAVLLLGFGTAAWSVAANTAWTHAPGMLGLAIGLWGMARGRYVAGGLGFAIAILSRPHNAIVAAVIGIWVAVSRRSWRTLIVLGAVSSLGLLGLVLWNKTNLGTWTLLPGSYASRPDNAVSIGSGGSNQLVSWLGDLAATFGSPWRGVLVLSPFLLLLLPGVVRAWRAAPDWVRGATVAAGVYLVVQLAGNTWTGGTGFFGNRLVLEPLTLLTPLLAIAWVEWTERAAWRRWTFIALAAASVWWFALAAGSFKNLDAERTWRDWEVGRMIPFAGASGILVSAAFAALIVAIPFLYESRLTRRAGAAATTAAPQASEAAGATDAAPEAPRS